jgi:putative intracellular protease/amidase
MITQLPLLFVWCAVAGAEPALTSGLLAEGTRWETPFYVSDSGVDGPRLLVVGGIHGNEPAGSRAADQIRHWPVAKGRLVVVPRANVPGLAANTRFLPGEPDDRRDLNRNFPGERLEDGARGEIARAFWQFVEGQDPDWILDLHEGYEFHVSHQPPKGKEKSVGSSVIYRKGPCLDPIARRMQEAADGLVSDPARRFVLLDRGPKKTSLVSACTRHVGARGMILETTFSRQPLSLRTRQHRAMVNVLMRHLGMIDRDCVDVLTPPRPRDTAWVALYDGGGTGGRGVERLTGIIDRAPDMAVEHVGPADMRPAVLERFDVIVFPGGSGSKQAAALGPEGRENVRGFVREGGGYLGICGGAYLCSAHYPWSLDLIDTAVFTGWREIEGVGRKSMWYRGESAVVKMQLTDEGKERFPDVPEHVEVKFQNGPIVSPKRAPGLSPYEVLAHFRSENVLYEPQRGTMVDTPAIVAGRFHQGRVISISPHP